MSDFVENVRRISRQLENYRVASTTGSARVVDQLPMRDIAERLQLASLLECGGLTGDVLEQFVQHYLELSTHLHHPGSLAHQVAAPHPAAALATLVEGFTNNPMAIYEMGPAAATLEAFLVDWLIGKVGWTSAPYHASGTGGAGGVLTHGGSLANLTALVAARSHFDGSVWAQGGGNDLAVLATSSSHYSIARAVAIMGVGEQGLYTVPDGSEPASGLATLIDRARAAGRRPFAVIANACSTATGVFDPLLPVARICREQGLWLHVDGAHGASALLSPRRRALLDGIELADSLTWDAHKLMCTPGLCTALLVRDARTLDTAFHQDASYLFHAKEQPGFDFIQRTVECTKASLGLRLFMVLAALGEHGLADYLDRQFDLALDAYRLYRGIPGLECFGEPQSNILCFRVAGDDDLQLHVRDRLLAAGDFHLSTAIVGGRRYLRIVITSPATELAHLERLAARVLETAQVLRT